MQTVNEQSSTDTATIDLFDAQCCAREYVATHLDPAFGVVEGTCYYHKGLGRDVWQFTIRSTHGPLDAIHVDAKTGVVIPLQPSHLHAIRERAAIAEARTRGVLPIDANSYVLSEYARRKANGYLSNEVALACTATDGVLIPLARPIWQFAIRFGLPRLGELGILGTLDVDARTGEIIPLTIKQVKQMQARADALVEFRTHPATA